MMAPFMKGLLYRTFYPCQEAVILTFTDQWIKYNPMEKEGIAEDIKYLNYKIVVAGLVLTIIFSVPFAFFLANFKYSELFLLSLAVVILSVILMRKTGPLFNFKKLTITAFFWYTYMLVIYIPAFFIYFEKVGPYRNIFFIAVNSVLITIPLGALVANKLFWFKKETIDGFYEKPIQAVDSGPARRVFLGLLGFCVFFTMMYILEVRKVPLFEILKHPNLIDFARILRAESFLNLPSKFKYIYSWIRSGIYPFLIMYSFGNFIVLKKKFWKWSFFSSFIFGVFFNSLTTEKLPVAAIFIMLMLFYLLYKNWKINVLFYVIAPLVILAIPTLFLTIIIPKEQVILQKMVGSIITRSFRVPAEVLYLYFEIFPDKIGYLGFSAIKTIASFLGLQYFDIPVFVMKYWLKTPVTTGYANACFVGTMNAGWGIAGVLFIGILAGFLQQAAQIFIVKRFRTILSLTLLTLLMYLSFSLNSAELFVILQSLGGFISFLVFWLIYRKEKEHY